MTGNRPGHLLRHSLRQHPTDEVGPLTERLDQLVRIAFGDFRDRKPGDCVSADVSNRIAICICVKASVLPRVSDKPNLFSTDACERGERFHGRFLSAAAAATPTSLCRPGAAHSSARTILCHIHYRHSTGPLIPELEDRAIGKGGPVIQRENHAGMGERGELAG